MRPESEDAVADHVKASAAARKTIAIQGGGSRQSLGRPIETDEQLETSALTGVSLYEPGALTLVARAGEPVSAIDALLAKEGQRLAFEPMDCRALLGAEATEPTIGGLVATAMSGPRRVQVGGCRDTLIGVRFVNGKGEIVKAGGRVMKNVTGYDLARLMAGAYGTLGILTEVAFKTVPTNEAAATLRISGLSDARAIEALSAALGSPFDISGAAHLPEAAATGAAIPSGALVRVEGFADSVAYRAAKLRDMLKPFGAVDLIDEAAAVEGMWRGIRDCTPFADQNSAVWRILVRPTDAPALTASIGAARDAAWFYDLGGALIWLKTPETGDAGAAVIRAEAGKYGARATLFRATPSTRQAVEPFPPEARGVARVSAGLKAAFDPHGILNPGRLASV